MTLHVIRTSIDSCGTCQFISLWLCTSNLKIFQVLYAVILCWLSTWTRSYTYIQLNFKSQNVKQSHNAWSAGVDCFNGITNNKKQIGASWSKHNLESKRNWASMISRGAFSAVCINMKAEFMERHHPCTKSKEEMDDVEQNFARTDRTIKMQQGHLQNRQKSV
ncbi:hypothetical protein PIB30_043670 [Stylosanthes scabra]|uniref:Uncharacterized protein n=1 Tax=Stylosanthes scabra TaxID=79078 RepID=A0ABU6ZEC1_9FABA|nr:hypothetical protein [Stylosanthes scabra]